MPSPSAALKATKVHRAGRPIMKIAAHPTAKTNPINPGPTVSLCIVMPECHFSAIPHLSIANLPTKSQREQTKSGNPDDTKF
jgi:hypothetical protein